MARWPLPTERPQPLEWVDRHKLWRKILADYKELASRAPEGFRPVVKVYLRTRATSLELGFVRTSRDPNYPWVRLEITKGVPPGDDSAPVPSDAQWLYVREEDVDRVELFLEEARTGL